MSSVGVPTSPARDVDCLRSGERRRLRLARFRHDDQPFGSRHPVGRAEDRHAALAYAGQLADRLFQFIGIDVAPAADDHVLGAAGDMDVAVGDIGEVTRIEPAVADQFLGLLGIAQVARGRRRTAEVQVSHAAVRHFRNGVIDNPNLVPGSDARRRQSAAGLVVSGWDGTACVLKYRALHSVHNGGAPAESPA